MHTVEWYSYFGIARVVLASMHWLLKNKFRIVLTALRIAIKYLLWCALAFCLLWLGVTVFGT